MTLPMITEWLRVPPDIAKTSSLYHSCLASAVSSKARYASRVMRTGPVIVCASMTFLP